MFCHVSKTCHFTAYFTSLWASISVSMLILQVTSSIFCLYLLNIYHFTYTFSHAHTETRTHKHTCMKSRRCDDNQQIKVTHFGENKRLHLESSKQNYYIISLWAIIKAIFIHLISRQEDWRQPGTGAWLGGAEERLLLETMAHTH